MKHLIILAGTASLLAAPVFAQNAPAKPMTSPTAAQLSGGQTDSGHQAAAVQATANDHEGITMAQSAKFAVRFVTPKPADVMTSKLVGLDVYNRQNEKLGEIEDLSIANGKSITGVVVSVGGFLGMGEKYVLIDPATVVVNEHDGAWKAFIDTTKDSLKSAPEFKYTHVKS